MNNISHHFRTFDRNTQFVYFSDAEKFSAREQQVKKESREAVDNIKENLATMTVEEAVKTARDKIDGIEKTNADWYINNKELYSVRGNEYQKRVYELCGKARQLIRNRMEDFKFTRVMVDDVTKARVEAAGLQPEYKRLSPIIGKVMVNVDINSREDIETTYTSLDNILDMKTDTEALYKSLKTAYVTIAHSLRFTPKSIQVPAKTEIAAMETQLDTLQSGYTSLVDNYNAGVKKLKASIATKVAQEEENIDTYRAESGALQEKAKTGGVKDAQLDAAYKKYTGQKLYARDLQAFQDVLTVYKEVPAGGVQEEKKEKEA